MAVPGAGKAASERQWLADLDNLRRSAHFADVAWVADDPARIVKGHKCIVYARATGSFQQRYLGVPSSISESDLSLYGPSSSFRTFTPTSSQTHTGSLTPVQYSHGRSPRPSSSTNHSTSDETAVAGLRPLSLGATDIGVFEAALEYLYTATGETEAFAVVLDGFQDEASEGEGDVDAKEKLRQDLLYCWRSKLYADVSLVLDGADSAPFAAHRAILAARSPYFRSLLLGNYSDSAQSTFTLPSPPFTPASTTFVLGYIYAGTLDFSSRKFDLATSFEIWRCAAFLGISALQEEIEDKMTGMLNLPRAARIFAFAHAPDVSSTSLAKVALPHVLDRFEEVWASPAVGHLPYDVQKQLVRHVCGAIRPDTVAKVARKVAGLRNRLDSDQSVWADHVRSMLEAIEEELVAVLATGLPAVIASPGFVDLIDGVGFSTDVLEWLLGLVVRGLTEAKAAESYQALVGSVLLREEGILADARVLVEDAKNGILKYIKRKWLNIRTAGGFDELESWCLKELADELEISTTDLTADSPRLRPSPARARQAPRRLLEGTPATLRQRPSDSSLLPARRPQLAKASPAPSASARPPPRSSAASVSSATSTASALDSRTSSRRPTDSSAADRAAPSPPAAIAGRVRAPPVSSSTPSTRPLPRAATSRPSPNPTPPPIPLPVSAPNATVAPARARTASASRAAHASPTAPIAPTSRRPPSPSPSVASRRTVASVASTRTARAGAPTRSATSPRPTAAARPSLGASSRPNPARPAGSEPPRPRTVSASSSMSTPSISSQTASLRRPPSSSTLASTHSTSRGAARPALKPAAAASPRPAATSTPRSGPAPTTSKRTIRASPSSGSVRSRSTQPSAKAAPPPLPGTSLLAGIPCIVTVRGTRPMRIKAMVRYIGQLVGEPGQWVGVEAAESVIPAEAQDLAWNDGSNGGIVYFKLSQPEPARTTIIDKGKGLTAPNETGSGSASTSASSSGASSLRPPSRRERRSTSSDSDGTGRRKGLFVRPDQILYVM